MLTTLRTLSQQLGAMRALRRRFPSAALHHTCEVVGETRLHLDAGVSVGRGSRIVISDDGAIEIGAGSYIGDFCELASCGTLRVGARTSLQHRSQLHGDVTIGAGCVCAANLYVSSAQHAFELRPELPIRVQDRLASETPWAQRSRPVVIGDDCWLGINVAVMPGVTIGRGCVVGASSVVTQDLAPYSIAAGAPARVLRARLAFVPPAAVSASRDVDLPYFYEGFRQLGPSEAADTSVPRLRGGLAAGARFALALAATGSSDLRLDVSATSDGRLSHGDTTRHVASGSQSLVFPARPERWSLLPFTWSSADPLREDSLVVVAAQIASRAEGEAR